MFKMTEAHRESRYCTSSENELAWNGLFFRVHDVELSLEATIAVLWVRISDESFQVLTIRSKRLAMFSLVHLSGQVLSRLVFS